MDLGAQGLRAKAGLRAKGGKAGKTGSPQAAPSNAYNGMVSMCMEMEAQGLPLDVEGLIWPQTSRTYSENPSKCYTMHLLPGDVRCVLCLVLVICPALFQQR